MTGKRMATILGICLMVMIFFGYALSKREAEPSTHSKNHVESSTPTSSTTIAVNPGGPPILIK